MRSEKLLLVFHIFLDKWLAGFGDSWQYIISVKPDRTKKMRALVLKIFPSHQHYGAPTFGGILSKYPIKPAAKLNRELGVLPPTTMDSSNRSANPRSCRHSEALKVFSSDV